MPAPRDPRSRRILSLWFPRLAAERARRVERGLWDAPLAIAGERGNMRLLTSVTGEAAARGLSRGQALQEALAICPDLVTRPEAPEREAAFLQALRRWAGKFSPWVAEEGRESLLVDLTGCAHLFGGEDALLEVVASDCARIGLTVRAGIADTAGAAWALARFGGQAVGPGGARSGDAIEQEARATRSRAQKRRHWERGGPAPSAPPPRAGAPAGIGVIAPPGKVRQAIGPLPVAALRLEERAVAGLARLGLRQVSDLFGMARPALARRFGQTLVRRLDQALGLEAEPISPARAPLHFAARLSLPEPIGLEADILAALGRLLPALCDRLREKGRGARRVRLELARAGGGWERVEVGLARPTDRPDRIAPLFALKLGGIEAGYGFDTVRVAAPLTEPLNQRQAKGGMAVAREVAAASGDSDALADLVGRIGARVGLEAITRAHPAESHIPEKTETVQAAAWSDPAPDWPRPARPRPLTLFAPEPVTAPDRPDPPGTFRWRGRDFHTLSATGPERIAPEWWLDDPAWRSGVRDYWRVDTEEGARLWLFFAHGAATTGGWFAHGDFA